MTITTQQFNPVNVGTAANYGDGDDLRTAFIKVNSSFSNISTLGFNAANILASGTVQARAFAGDGSLITNVAATVTYTNSNVAAYLPTYSGNVAALTVLGNLVVLGNTITYKNEIITQNEIVTGNIVFAGNLSGNIITSTVGSDANLTLDPDGNGDVVAVANLWLTSGYLRTTSSTLYLSNATPTTGWMLGNASNVYIANVNSTTYIAGNVNAGGNITTTGYHVGNAAPGGTNTLSLGYMNIPQNSIGNSSYILTLTDQGKHILNQTSTTANIYIPTYANVAWPVGSAITIVLANSAATVGNVSIVANTGVTLYMAGNVTSGSNVRVLSTAGMATLLNVANNIWFINGTGLT